MSCTTGNCNIGPKRPLHHPHHVHCYPVIKHPSRPIIAGLVNVIDSLLSTRTRDALSANQGRILKELIDSNHQEINDRLDQEIITINNRIDAEIETINNRITSEVNTINNRITSEVNTINNRIDKEVADLTDYIDSNISDVNSRIDREVQTINNRITSEVNTLNTKIDNAVTEINQSITNLSNRVTTEVARLDGRIDQVITDLTALETKVDNNYTTLNNNINTLRNDMNTALDTKVDKVEGMGLSQENYTTAEKEKLAGLESSHFRGEFPSEDELFTQIPVGNTGDYAYVDEGAAQDVVKYIWDTTDSKWVKQLGESTAETPASIKEKYESNPDTNAYTDLEKTKLGRIDYANFVGTLQKRSTGYVFVTGWENVNTGTTSTSTGTIPLARRDEFGLMSTDDKIKLDGITTYMNDIGTNSRNEDLVLFSKSLYNPFTNTNTTSTLEVPYATERYAGVMRSVDKAKLDSIQQGALANNNTFLTFNLNSGSIRANLQNALGSIYGRNGITTSGRGGTLSLIADIEGELFSRAVMGMVPPPGGNTTNRFLREDGTWEVVESGGGSGTTYTFANGTNGSFTVIPEGGSAQTVSVGKPSTAGVADSAETANKVANALSINLNGTTSSYNGSSAVSLTINTSIVGATQSDSKLFVLGAASQSDSVSSYSNSSVYTLSGNFHCGAGFFDDSVTSSDIRLKTDIESVNTDKISTLDIKQYVKKGKKEVGIIAQDVQKIRPEFVKEHEDILYVDDKSVLYSMIADLREEIEKLKKQ